MDEKAIQDAIDTLNAKVNSLALQQAAFREELDAHCDNLDDNGNTHLAPDASVGDVFQADLGKTKEELEQALKQAVTDASSMVASAQLIETTEFVKAAKLGMIQQIHVTNGPDAGKAAWRALANWETGGEPGPYPFE